MLPDGRATLAPFFTHTLCPRQAAIDVCPSSCVNLGSFHVVFEAPQPCICGGEEAVPMLLATATDTWKVRA